MENISERRNNYIQRLDTFNRTLKAKNLKSPKEIIAKGVRESTAINDDNTVNMLTDKAVRAVPYIKEKDYDVFLFGIAESLESIRCETTSQNEYFTWIDDSVKIMDHLTDGEITEEDDKERDNFIDESWQREAEILTCLGLYERSNNPLAKQRKAELLIKLQRLRQIRSALTAVAKNNVDSTREERYKAAMYALALKQVRKYDAVGDYNNEEVGRSLEDLSISHFDDFEFYNGYSFYTRMLEEQVRFDAQQKLRQLDMVKGYADRPGEYLAMVRHKDDTKENIRDRLARLSGIRGSARQDMDKVKIPYKERHFDLERFNALKARGYTYP